jgi:hypothetical protein
MGLWTDVIGTVRGYIRLGLTGVRLKNSSGALAVRNAGDSAYADVECGNVNVGPGGKVTFEGTTDDAYEMAIDPGDPTADRTLTLPNKSGTLATTDDVAAGMPRSYLAGLTLSNNGSDATNDIDIAAGACRDATNAVDMVLASALTKRLDAAWAVGTNQGGLDTGSIANDVYHIWLIKRSDTGVVDALFSASATSPTMPANYDYKRRIGAIIRASGAIRTFVQDGDLFRLKASVLDVGSTNPGTSSVTSAVTVPDGINVGWIGNVEFNTGAGTASALYLRDADATDEAASGTAAPLAAIRCGTSDQQMLHVRGLRTDTSAQIYWRLNASDANVAVRMATLGWFDSRGKND